MREVNLRDIRQKIVNGMQLCANTVRVTMGPKGKNVVIDNGGTPTFTNDGVTVIKAITANDPIENIGVSMVKEACEKTNKEAGDGTTTTAVLAYAIASEGLRYIDKGINPFMLGKALNEVGKEIIDIVKSQGKRLNTKREVRQIAAISSQDAEIGNIIANVMSDIGNDGTITVEDGQVLGLHSEIKKGLQYDTGFVSLYMANQGANDFMGKDVPILVTDLRIENFKQIKPIMAKLLEEKQQNLVIFCPEIENDALANISLNKIKGIFNCVVIKAPGFGQLTNYMLGDIAVSTGAQFYTEELKDKLEDITITGLGRATKIQATMSTCLILEGKGTQEHIDTRIESIRSDIEKSAGYEKEKHQERLSKMSGGIAVIRVGASTEMELKNKKFKIEDALNATRSAVQEGIVDGGGIALAMLHLNRRTDQYGALAQKILGKAIKYPFQQIVLNAGFCPNRIERKMPIGQGFDAKEGVYCNMIEKGIIDPIKVIRVALQNAISTATMLLTTEATITDSLSTK